MARFKKAPKSPAKVSLEGREPPLTLRRENQYLYFGCFFPVRRGLFPVVRDFLCIIPTEQVLYYRNLGLYYGLASGTLPLYSDPCLGVRGGCVACDFCGSLLAFFPGNESRRLFFLGGGGPKWGGFGWGAKRLG